MPFISIPSLNFTTMVKKLDIQPTYELSSSATQVDEGQQFTISLNTTNVPEGTQVPYTLSGDSGVSIDDLKGKFYLYNSIVKNKSFETSLGDWQCQKDIHNSGSFSHSSDYDGSVLLKLVQKQIYGNAAAVYCASVTQNVDYNFEDGENYKIKVNIGNWTSDKQLIIGIYQKNSSMDSWNMFVDSTPISLTEGLISSYLPSGSGEVELSFTANSLISDGCMIYVGYSGWKTNGTLANTSSGEMNVSEVKITDSNDVEIFQYEDEFTPVISNGNFDVDLGYWGVRAENQTFWSNGACKLLGDGLIMGHLRQSVTNYDFVYGETYKLKFDIPSVFLSTTSIDRNFAFGVWPASNNYFPGHSSLLDSIDMSDWVSGWSAGIQTLPNYNSSGNTPVELEFTVNQEIIESGGIYLKFYFGGEGALYNNSSNNCSMTIDNVKLTDSQDNDLLVFSNLSGMTGNFTVDANGQASITYLVKNDSVVEGTETLTLSLDNGEDSVNLDLIDQTNIEYGFWDDGSWGVSVSSWKNSPDTVIGNGSFEEGIEGWDNHSEENFTDENGKEHVFDTSWNPDTQRMKYELTPNDFQFQSIASKLIQYPFDSDVWYKFKSTINYLPEDVTPFTKFILSIWKEGDVPDINNTLAEQSFDVDQLTNGQEISLDFMPTDEIDGVLESLQMGFRLSDDSTDSTDNVVVEVDDVKVTDSEDNELERNYTLLLETNTWDTVSQSWNSVPIGENGLPSVNEGDTIYLVLETNGLVENTKVPFFVESPEGEGPSYSLVWNDKMTDRDEFGHQYNPNVFELKEKSTTIMRSTRRSMWVLPNVVCIQPQTIAIWVPHPKLDGRENALAEIELEVMPNELEDKSQCEPNYISIQKNNASPQEGDSMGFDLVGERMTNEIIPEGSEYPIGTWEITGSTILISSPTSGSFIIDDDNIVSITVVQTASDNVYTGGGGFTMTVTIGETSLSVGASFTDSTDPPEDP